MKFWLHLRLLTPGAIFAFTHISKTSNLSHLATCNPSATLGDHQVSTPYHMVQLLATIQCHYLSGYNSDLFWGPNSNFQPVSHPYLDSLGKFQRCTFLIWTPKSSLCAIGQVSLETSHGKMDYLPWLISPPLWPTQPYCSPCPLWTPEDRVFTMKETWWGLDTSNSIVPKTITSQITTFVTSVPLPFGLRVLPGFWVR